jgi:hypothetical protein
LIARRCAKIFEPGGTIQVQELPACGAFDGLKPSNPEVIEEPLGFGALERPDQLREYYV